jgi:hypothetical protein
VGKPGQGRGSRDMVKERVEMSCLWWMSGFEDSLEAGGKSITGDAVHVCHGVYVGVGAGFSTLPHGLELEAQGLGGSILVMRESWPVLCVGTEAQLGSHHGKIPWEGAIPGKDGDLVSVAPSCPTGVVSCCCCQFHHSSGCQCRCFGCHCCGCCCCFCYCSMREGAMVWQG